MVTSVTMEVDQANNRWSFYSSQALLGKSELFRVLFGSDWTFSYTFWEKVDIFTYFVRESGLFYMLFGRKQVRWHVP